MCLSLFTTVRGSRPQRPLPHVNPYTAVPEVVPVRRRRRRRTTTEMLRPPRPVVNDRLRLKLTLPLRLRRRRRRTSIEILMTTRTRRRRRRRTLRLRLLLLLLPDEELLELPEQPPVRSSLASRSMASDSFCWSASCIVIPSINLLWGDSPLATIFRRQDRCARTSSPRTVGRFRGFFHASPFSANRDEKFRM
jgi:hypothetical protein